MALRQNLIFYVDSYLSPPPPLVSVSYSSLSEYLLLRFLQLDRSSTYCFIGGFHKKIINKSRIGVYE